MPYESLHRRHVHTLLEVREALSGPAAEEWSRACANFGKQLSAPRVSLPDGIEIVGEWVWRLRELLQAMGATELLPYPDGRSPTPTNLRIADLPTAANPATLAAAEAEAVERMRQVIRGADNGRAAKADSLIKAAEINRRRGREALRRLQATGEYDGFARQRPRRYAEGSTSAS